MKSSPPTASVIVPVYNAEDTLPAAIESALRSDCDIEILVVDDGSTDNSVDVAKAYASSNVTVLSTGMTRAGPSYARNLALERAQGDWLAVLDADDAYSPNRLDSLIETARRLGVAAVVDDVCVVDSTGEIPTFAVMESRGIRTDGDKILNASGLTYFDLGITKPVVHTSALREAGLRYRAHGRATEDFAFLLDCSIFLGGVGLDPRPTYIYRKRPGSVSAPSPRFWLDSMSVTIELLRAHGSNDVLLGRLLRRRLAMSKRRYQYLLAKGAFQDSRSLKTLSQLLLEPHSWERLVASGCASISRHAWSHVRTEVD